MKKDNIVRYTDKNLKGKKVKRGEVWNSVWADQGKGCVYGTIIENLDPVLNTTKNNWINVMWENGTSYNYRIGPIDYDLEYYLGEGETALSYIDKFISLHEKS